jgi:predicted alpha/beta-hydrolase family hydrolase
MELDLDTPHGPARVYLHPAEGDPVALLVLGHGANGQVRAPDLLKATEVANAEGVSVALVEQPYKVAGRRAPAPAAQLDAAFTAVVEHLRAGAPVILGGRSMGARVACRTADALGAIGVLCLAFPVHPPGRPEKSRLEELDAVEAPVLVVQGSRDAFGMPPLAPGREIVEIEGGDHSLKRDLDSVGAAVAAWLQRVTRSPRAPAGT